MRSDMHEIIIERPRWGHRRRYRRAYARNQTRSREGAEETFPLRERMGGFYREKALSDNLAQLERYLRSQVGRPWSKVWSEIAAQLAVTSAIKKHVMDHLREYVVEHVREDEDGHFWGADFYGRPAPPRQFYVHPGSGALAEVTPRPRKKKSRERIPRPDVKVLSPTSQLRRVRGIWYAVTIGTLPHTLGPRSVDVVRDAIAKVDPRRHRYRPEHEAMRDLWDEGRYAHSIRQLSKREIRRLLGGS